MKDKFDQTKKNEMMKGKPKLEKRKITSQDDDISGEQFSSDEEVPKKK